MAKTYPHCERGRVGINATWPQPFCWEELEPGLWAVGLQEGLIGQGGKAEVKRKCLLDHVLMEGVQLMAGSVHVTGVAIPLLHQSYTEDVRRPYCLAPFP